MSCFIKRILQFKEAIPKSTIYINDDNGNDMTQLCKYSWSTDGVCWTNWSDYNTYLIRIKNIETDYYLRILIVFNIGIVKVNNIITNCYNLTLDTENIFLKDFCSEPNLFQPYNNLECALQLQQQLSDSVICMFGIPVYYFQVSPDESTADYTFKEYVLHNVVDVKQIKLMIQDGQMPSSNYRLSDFDFDWETDWETEISKTQFAAAFGDTAIPNENDFIYIPLMKRMWNVNSAYDEKNEGLMWRSTTWKLSLVKYNNSTNIDTGNFEDIIDNLIINKYEDVLGKLETNEQERETGSTPLTSPSYTANTTYNIFKGDAVRLTATSTTNVIDKTICHRNNIVARNIYNLNESDCIIYQKGICGEEGSLSFIFNTDNLSIEKNPILSFGELIINIYNKNIPVIEFENQELDLEFDNTYMFICRWNRDNYNIDIDIYKHIHREGIPIYSLRPEMFWFDMENPIYSITIPYNNDYISKNPKQCKIQGPINITNIKYYNKYLDKPTILKESIKYITNNDNCIINDLARPFNNGFGYSVR